MPLGAARAVLSSSAVITPYSANAVNFDGTNDYLTRAAGLTNAADSTLATVSFWFRYASASAPATAQAVFRGPGQGGLIIERGTNNAVSVAGWSPTPTQILAVATAAISDTNWHHMMFSADLTDTGKRHLWLDAADVAPTWTTYTNASFDFTETDWGVGARPDTAADKWNGDLADLQLWFGTYLDLSQAANRQMFISSGGPVDPATAVASLGNAIVRLAGATATWHTNQGTGGGFTENGALTDGQTPVELP